MPGKRFGWLLAALVCTALPLCAALAAGGDATAPTPAPETSAAAEAGDETETPAPADEEADAEAPADAADAEASNGIVALSVETVEATGAETRVALRMRDCAEVDSLQLRLNYDPKALRVRYVLAGDLFPAQYVVTNYDTAGVIAVACAGIDIPSEGTVLTVVFRGTGGTAVTVTDATLTRYTPETGQTYAYMTIENGGVSTGGSLPAPLVTPFSPPTPTPSPTPAPTPTAEPTPTVTVAPETPEPSPTPLPAPEPQKLLPVVLTALGVLVAVAVVLVVVLVKQDQKKKKRKKKRRRRPAPPAE